MSLGFATLTRELNGVLVTECLSYIHLANDSYYTKPSLLVKIKEGRLDLFYFSGYFLFSF